MDREISGGFGIFSHLDSKPVWIKYQGQSKGPSLITASQLITAEQGLGLLHIHPQHIKIWGVQLCQRHNRIWTFQPNSATQDPSGMEREHTPTCTCNVPTVPLS